MAKLDRNSCISLRYCHENGSLDSFSMLWHIILYMALPINLYFNFSCFSCASEVLLNIIFNYNLILKEYEKLFQRSKNSALFGRPLLFDRLCDTRIDLGSLSPSALVPCDTACISVLEPQFFGGKFNLKFFKINLIKKVFKMSVDLFPLLEDVLLIFLN